MTRSIIATESQLPLIYLWLTFLGAWGARHMFTVRWMLSLSLQLWCMNIVSDLDKFKVVDFLYCGNMRVETNSNNWVSD